MFDGGQMDFDEDKIDEYTLALLFLVSHERHEGLGARAWKGFDWDTLNRLHDKGYISNPVGKAKSIGMSEKGFLKAKELFESHFSSRRNNNEPQFPRTICPQGVYRFPFKPLCGQLSL
jgi:hypothetical protein